MPLIRFPRRTQASAPQPAAITSQHPLGPAFQLAGSRSRPRRRRRS